MSNPNEVQCYNRGCGQKFDPKNNKDDSCRHHPGQPVFHDAYKGWGCCNKKCTDFTEFLNIKGCTLSKHSDVKPPEPEKPKNDEIVDIVEVKPIIRTTLERPPFESPLITMKPTIAPSLEKQLTPTIINSQEEQLNKADEIVIGTTCKNGGCTATYEGPETNNNTCTYHPGVPIFHEGMKYWSCCQRKTSDFNSFLSQVGCEQGNHVWKKENEGSKIVNCRWDFHQTPTDVYVSIYAKQYCVQESTVHLNPIRLVAKLIFPQQSDASFTLDVELRGIIDVNQSEVNMFATKLEIKMRKAEPGSWLKLGELVQQQTEIKLKPNTAETLLPRVEDVNLDDL